MKKCRQAKQSKTVEQTAPDLKKKIVFTQQAATFFAEQTAEVQQAFFAKLAKLASIGYLSEPEAKVIAPNLFEIRVKVHPNQYRLFYCYIDDDKVLALSGFIKKTAKTPKKEIEKAKAVRNSYKLKNGEAK